MKYILKLLGTLSTSLCIISGLNTFFIIERSVPAATLNFYHSTGLFFIAVGLLTGPVV